MAAANYTHFIAVFNNSGVESSCTEIETSFAKAKKIAIDTVKLIYERHHGRGNHGVKMYGAREYDGIPEYLSKSGVPPYWVWAREELVFEF